MNRNLLFLTSMLFISFYSVAKVTPESCLDISRSVGVSMTDAMVEDFNIRESDLMLRKTRLTLLGEYNVTGEMARFFAQQDLKELGLPDEKINEYIGIYKGDNPKNLIVNYDYVNKRDKHNVFIASQLINDYECSLRFNGYIIVRREF